MGICEAKPVIDEAFRGIPPTIGIQDHEKQIAAILRNLRDKASTGFGSESGLHPYYTWNATK